MRKHLTVSPSEAADRLAIRELVEAYAHCADRRDANGHEVQMTVAAAVLGVAFPILIVLHLGASLGSPFR
jgi:hypothetical protein